MDLLKKLKEKDRLAFAYLFDQYAPALCSVTEAITQEPELTNDILLKVFASIYNKIDQYEESKGSLYVWMLNITRSEALAAKNKTGIGKLKAGNEALPAFYSICGLKQLIGQLPDPCRSVLNLCYFEGMNNEAIAIQLNFSVEKVVACRRKALSVLPRLLNWQITYGNLREPMY